MLAERSCVGEWRASYEFPSSFNAIALAAMAGEGGLGSTGFGARALFFCGCGFGQMGWS